MQSSSGDALVPERQAQGRSPNRGSSGAAESAIVTVGPVRNDLIPGGRSLAVPLRRSPSARFARSLTIESIPDTSRPANRRRAHRGRNESSPILQRPTGKRFPSDHISARQRTTPAHQGAPRRTPIIPDRLNALRLAGPGCRGVADFAAATQGSVIEAIRYQHRTPAHRGERRHRDGRPPSAIESEADARGSAAATGASVTKRERPDPRRSDPAITCAMAHRRTPAHRCGAPWRTEAHADNPTKCGRATDSRDSSTIESVPMASSPGAPRRAHR